MLCNGNMNGAIDADYRTYPLRSLPSKTRRILSCLLNPQKVFLSDGVKGLPRDWRGLASLANISAEVVSNFEQSNDKTARVLDAWISQTTPTIGNLLDTLEKLDRYDVYDDVCNDLEEHAERGEIVVNYQISLQRPNPDIVVENGSINKAITIDDDIGYEHKYHAYVLYADEDQEFVDELYSRMSDEGFDLCTKERLLPGHATEYAPISQLISDRCQRIILVYSPEFLLSFANSFYRDYAQAVSIGSNQGKLIPIMYRPCQLPPHLTFYHNLKYTEANNLTDFWGKLQRSLATCGLPSRKLNVSTSSVPTSVTIEEISEKNNNALSAVEDHYFVAAKSASMHNIPSKVPPAAAPDASSLGEKKKKWDPVAFGKNVLNIMKGKKTKKSKNTLVVPA